MTFILRLSIYNWCHGGSEMVAFRFSGRAIARGPFLSLSSRLQIAIRFFVRSKVVRSRKTASPCCWVGCADVQGCVTPQSAPRSCATVLPCAICKREETRACCSISCCLACLFTLGWVFRFCQNSKQDLP